MTLAHMVSCVLFSEALKFLGVIEYPDINLKIARQVAPLSLAFVLNIVVGLSALRVVNVPMFTTLRRLSGLFILVLEWAVLGIKPQKRTVLALSVILTGAAIAGSGDLGFDVVSYMWVVANNVLTAGHLIAIKVLDRGIVLSPFGKTYFNSLLSIPWLLIIATVNGELSRIWDYEFLFDRGFQMAFLVSAILAFAVNGATFWCTTQTNALTTSVTGQCKNIIVTFLGMFLFGDVQPNLTLLVGLSIGIFGSVLFSYIETTKKMKTSKTASTGENSRLPGDKGKPVEFSADSDIEKQHA